MTTAQETSLQTIGAAGQVPREQLVRKIKTCAATKHIFITAAGGYGKTVAASQWLATVRGNKAKLVAGAEDNVPGFFYKRLATALLKLAGKQSLIPDVAISFDKLLEIMGKLPAKSKRSYLVIDDVHLIRNEEIIKRSPVLMQNIPAYIRCCIISASEPTSALVETGLFEIITKDDLVFSNDEIEWLGIEKGVELSPSRIEELREKTGGWVAYLLAMLSGRFDAAGLSDEKTPRALMQFIQSRVWETTAEETKLLLLRLAVPDVINPELCKLLTGCGEGAKSLLRKISREENAFMKPAGTGKDEYYFHEFFREFLLSRINDYFSEPEICNLHEALGDWHFRRGEYYEGARHFIINKDHEGITKCLSEALRYLKETSHISVEVRLYHAKQYLKDLPEDFIFENPYLISWCATAAFYDGDTVAFFRFLDALYERLPEISKSHPELIQMVMFAYSLDFREPLLRQFDKALQTMPQTGRAAPDYPADARIGTFTQNLPFFHRSSRDYSELWGMDTEDLRLAERAHQAIIGDDYKAMGVAIAAGICFERGETIEATRHALAGYASCNDDMHPEIYFCFHMTLAVILYIIGAKPEAGAIIRKLDGFIDSRARFLMPNFKAVTTVLAVSGGDKKAAAQWLEVNAYKSAGRLPFYQICRHFATLYSFLALGSNDEAAQFGRRLQELSDNYRRPLDRMESRILTAIALRRKLEFGQSLRLLREAVEIAMPYGFVQTFVFSGRDVLPMLRELRRLRGIGEDIRKFAATVAAAISERYMIMMDDKPVPRLSQKQRIMLSLLDSGMTYREIAEKTGMGRPAVKYHLLTAYKKLGIHEARDAIARAKELGII